MKKIIYVSILFIGVLFLTACGSNVKTLKCTLSQKVNGKFGDMITEETVKYDEKKGEFGKVHYKLTVDLSEETTIEDSKKTEALAALKSSLQTTCDEALKKGADSCTVTAPKEFAIVIDSEGDVQSGIIDESIANIGTYEEMKSYFEGQNYTCKEE